MSVWKVLYVWHNNLTLCLASREKLTKYTYVLNSSILVPASTKVKNAHHSNTVLSEKSSSCLYQVKIFLLILMQRLRQEELISMQAFNRMQK